MRFLPRLAYAMKCAFRSRTHTRIAAVEQVPIQAPQRSMAGGGGPQETRIRQLTST
jgi:hypothetical protein